MKFIPSNLIDIIADKYESSENIIDQKGEIYCKTLTDYDSKIFFKNGVKYYGSIENGILNGKGTIIMPNGLKFTGNFINNQIEGKGLLEYSSNEYYNGEIQNLQRNGYGKYENKIDGITYEGDWKDDQFHGLGKLIVQNLWEYQGYFINGIKQGKGTVKYLSSGNLFEGNFNDNQKNGYGQMIWNKEKQLYKGNWINNQLNGFGIYIYKSDFQGEFVDNNREGFGIHYYSDSSVYIGLWKQGQKNGQAIFIDNNGFQNLKIFKNNHLIETQYVQNNDFTDYQIPKVQFIGTQNENWNNQILEKVVKTLNPNLRQIFEEHTQNEKTFHDVIKSISFTKFFFILKKIRFYDHYINKDVAKQIILKHNSCFTNVLINKENFLQIKQKYLYYIEGKIKNFELNFKQNQYSTMNYLQFINSIFILLQYKYQNSDNIERDIRSFISLRLLGILKKKIQIKVWIKDENLTLKKYSKTLQKIKVKINKIFLNLSNNKIFIRIKNIFQYLNEIQIFNFKEKTDLLLFFKVIERINDPLTSCYHQLRNKNNLEEFYKSHQYQNIMHQELSQKKFEQTLILLIHNKFLQKKIDVQKNTINFLENLQFPNNQSKFTKRYFKYKTIEQPQKVYNKVSQENIQSQENKSQSQEESIKSVTLQQDEKQSIIQQDEQENNEEKKQKTVVEIDSFIDGYFIELSSNNNMQLNIKIIIKQIFYLQILNNNMLTKFFYLLILITVTNEYEIDMSVQGIMQKFNSYSLLEVKLDIQKSQQKSIYKSCYKIFLDKDIEFKHMKLEYFNTDLKIAPAKQPDIYLPYHIEYTFPQKFYSYKVYIGDIDAKNLDCMIVYNQEIDDKILRIYLLTLPIDPNRGYYFSEEDPDKKFHIFSYPVLAMGKQIMHSIYYIGENEKDYINLVPKFLNFPNVSQYNQIQEQVYEILKVQYQSQDKKLTTVDMNQSFDEVHPIRYIYNIFNEETNQIEKRIYILFQQNDGINEFFFYENLLFFHDEINKGISQLYLEEDKPFSIDSFSFQNFDVIVDLSLQKKKSIPVQLIEEPQYKTFNFPSRLNILINKNLRFNSRDNIKIMSFMDENDQEYRVATFLKELRNNSLEVDYFPICFVYDEKNKVIRLANQTILYDLDPQNEEDVVKDDELFKIKQKRIYNFKNEQSLIKLKRKPKKFLIRISCKSQESPYSTKIIFVQLQENNKMCSIAFCKVKNDYIVQKQEIIEKQNSKNDKLNYLIIDIQPDMSKVL